VTGRRGKRCKQLLDNLKETRRYWKLKEEALDCIPWRARFRRGYAHVVRPTSDDVTSRAVESVHNTSYSDSISTAPVISLEYIYLIPNAFFLSSLAFKFIYH
jgi:hypothetical protein